MCKFHINIKAMKNLRSLLFFALMGLLVISCQRDSVSPDAMNTMDEQEFIVPDIPDEIAEMMSAEDIARFKAGPGEEYLELQGTSNLRKARGRWYPVLMRLGFHLQFMPFGGESCGAPQPCFAPDPNNPSIMLPTNAPNCDYGKPPSGLGLMGKTVADGYWFRHKVHSEYYPVFCLPDYSGYGSGFYQLDNSQLWLEAVNGPFQVDEEGNVTFIRKGNYIPGQSTGVFEGAVGWEVMISYTAIENSPSNSPDGSGYSDVIIFGWVYK
jgi:hypothetical protein